MRLNIPRFTWPTGVEMPLATQSGGLLVLLAVGTVEGFSSQHRKVFDCSHTDPTTTTVNKLQAR